MTKTVIKLVLIVIMCIGLYAIVNEKDRRIAELEARESTAEEATKVAFDDCKALMAGERIVSYINGCYTAVHTMCAGIEPCVRKYVQVCNVDGDEQ